MHRPALETSRLSEALQAEDRPDTVVTLPDSSLEVRIRTLLRRETAWTGDVPHAFRAVPNKPALAFGDRALYPEFILLRLLERTGWSGVWVKNWQGRAFWREVGVEVYLPPDRQALFKQIESCIGGRRGGCWDLFAWQGDNALFVESKQRSKDSLRPNQLAWLECALQRGVPLSSFLIVEWTIASVIQASDRPSGHK